MPRPRRCAAVARRRRHAPDPATAWREEADAARDPLAGARAALARGDLVSTYDLASAAYERGIDGAAYLIVLSLARMGDTAAARAQYSRLGLDRAQDVDTRALWARLLKDEAVQLSGEARIAALRGASAAYAGVYAETNDVFPGINAASLARLAGGRDEAEARAGELLARLRKPVDFWGGATRAEALLLLGRDTEARAAIERALLLPGSGAGARASTLRQLELLAAGAGLDPAGAVRSLLQALTTIYFCGHMFLADPLPETELAARIDATLNALSAGAGFGALACGADILIAERLLLRGGELNVVLPFAAGDFVPLSVDPGGTAWRERFERCLAQASSVHIVSTIGYIGDPSALRHASDVAMGLARLRARQHDGAATLLAVWDGTPARGVAGTALDVAAWRAGGGTSRVIDPGRIDRQLARAKLPSSYDGPPRTAAALIFADVPGFTNLPEIELPRFWEDVMGTVAKVLDRHAAAITSRNSWGDAIFVAVDNPVSAAQIALGLQEALASLGSGSTLRIGAHHGMVFATPDPITGNPTFYGHDVACAARIEPVTPPGQVYVTESFAAALAMAAPDAFRCHYVGQVELAKKFGTRSMYRLERTIS